MHEAISPSRPATAATRNGERETTLVLIASAGHSGSTLLDLLLANHSQICSAGEMNRLTLHAPDRVCACGATVTRCDYWNEVRAEISRRRQRHRLQWSQCHTDIPPELPIAQIPAGGTLEAGALPEWLQTEMLRAGLPAAESARLTRNGIRDFKWRVIDPSGRHNYVLRVVEDGVELYGEKVKWKKPTRVMPDPMEVALVTGQSLGVRLASHLPSGSAFLRIAENSWAVADAMAAVSAKPLVVDSSKSPSRLKLLYMLRPTQVRIVELVRDGRAVAASAMRRSGISATTAAQIWKRDNQNLAMMLRTVPQALRMRVHYEALSEQPQRELERACRFLGLAFESGMLTLWQRPVHNIPGNPMLFNRDATTIRKDERWRRDLSPADIAAIERVAGRMNRAFGYE